ncbi:hypothetical protein [Asticcacaulis sp. EMRT-3]|uniref:hypothetical protein n=1 Tax=Asticcacaulis sp. EMRT-3 TaxID=3040349 RepID=UPI0024AEA1F7|nr:hypothetical protein [Asticcacaulis sp. EMRT-3]MDI7773820.1 hypothetical protein [Asticcacaulis sp. EMRT-3]
MTEQTHTVHDDIAFMRQMAERGQRGPIMGGAFLTGAGLIFGAACFVQWAMQTGHLPEPTGARIAGLWGGATALWLVVWLILFFNLRKNCKAIPGNGQTAFGSAWAACGLGTIVMLIAVFITSNRLGNPELLSLMPMIAFAFYGAAWLVSGALARRGWMVLVSLCAFALALILAAMSDASLLIVMGAGLFATIFLPGLIMMRGTRN